MRRLLTVPFILLLQKFVYIYHLVPWQLTDRDCLIPRIYSTEYAEWAMRGIMHNSKRYFYTVIKGV